MVDLAHGILSLLICRRLMSMLRIIIQRPRATSMALGAEETEKRNRWLNRIRKMESRQHPQRRFE